MIIGKNDSKKILSLVIVLMFATSFLFVASAQTAMAAVFPVDAYIAAAPNPVGVGESVLVTSWLSEYPPRNLTIGSAPLIRWSFTVTIADPSGNTQTKQLTSDPIGGATFSFAPSAVGTWTLKLAFPETSYGGVTYSAATSNVFTLTVTQQPTPYWSPAPLPTGYWSRPVNAQNREWSTIAGNWLGFAGLGSPGQSGTYNRYGKFNPYSTAPKTPHVVWTKMLRLGGLVGGEYSTDDFYSGNSYDIPGMPSIIIDGRLYYNIPIGQSPSGGGFACVDIRTGQELWRRNGSISFGQLLAFDSLNGHGVQPYLFGYASGRQVLGVPANSIEVRDATTGDLMLTIVNATTTGSFVSSTTTWAGTTTGDILEYVLNAAQHTLVLWNSTQCIQFGGPSARAPALADYWSPVPGSQYDWKAGIMWNVTIPSTMPTGLAITKMSDDVILTFYQHPINATLGAGYGSDYELEAGFSTKDGHYMWVRNETDPTKMTVGQEASFGYVVSPTVWAVFKQETEQWFGFDINTGKQIWTTDPYTNPWGAYYTTIGDGPAYIAYGKLYAAAYDGTLHCYDITNGKNLWNTYIGSSGTETPYGQYPFFGSFVIADGKVYVGNGEHSPNTPYYRGESMWCFDANTGEILWRMEGWWQNPMVADGYLVMQNGYDMNWYGFGKGPTSTTVSPSPSVVTAGSEVTIKGTVYDVSSSAPANTPAVSRDSMEQYMEALYEQQPMPNNVTGVPVQLVAVDSAGVATTIGTVTTDNTGFYATHWKVPDTAGVYKIIANFAADDSYWTSSAIDAITVVAAGPTPASASDVASAVVSSLPVQTPVPTAPSASDVASQVVSQLPGEDNTLLYAAIAIGVIIAILVAVNIVISVGKRRQ